MQMQNDTRPIAKRTKKIKSNLGNKTDQLKIHKEVYRTYLMQDLELKPRQTEKLIKLYEELINGDQMPNVFPLPIAIFHTAFIQRLQKLA